MAFSDLLLPVRRLNCVYFSPSAQNQRPTAAAVSTFVSDLENLGYGLTPEALTMVENASKKVLRQFLVQLRDHLGDTAGYRTATLNFPREIVDASSWDLYLKSLKSYKDMYAGQVHHLPILISNKSQKTKTGQSDTLPVRMLAVATTADLEELAKNLVSQKVPYSETDQVDIFLLEEFVKVGPVGARENLAHLASVFPSLAWDDQFTTVTDVLRLAVAYSDGDVSLATNTRFSLTRSQRRKVMNLLEAVASKNKQSEQDFARYPEQWKRLARCLHHREHASSCPRASALMSKVQDGDARSEASLLEELFLKKDLNKLLPALEARPGVFSRRLVEVLRTFPQDHKRVLDSYEKVAGKVSLPALFSLWRLVNTPDASELPNRVITVKGRTVRHLTVENTPVPERDRVRKAVENGVAAKPFSRKVYLTDAPQGYAMPLQVRNASPGMTAVGRGSRLLLDEKPVVRLFVRWVNMPNGNSVDLDLSAVMVNETFTRSTAIAYYNQRSSTMRAYHSGDIVNAPAPHGATEFIDVDREGMLAGGYRYLLTSVYSYSGQLLSTVPKASMGFMLRENVNSNEIYDPATVKHCYPLTIATHNAVPWVIDMATGEAIWWDEAANPQRLHGYSAQGNEASILLRLNSFLATPPVMVSDVLRLRNITQVDHPTLADLVVDPQQPAQVLTLLEED